MISFQKIWTSFNALKIRSLFKITSLLLLLLYYLITVYYTWLTLVGIVIWTDRHLINTDDNTKYYFNGLINELISNWFHLTMVWFGSLSAGQGRDGVSLST